MHRPPTPCQHSQTATKRVTDGAVKGADNPTECSVSHLISYTLIFFQLLHTQHMSPLSLTFMKAGQGIHSKTRIREPKLDSMWTLLLLDPPTYRLSSASLSTLQGPLSLGLTYFHRGTPFSSMQVTVSVFTLLCTMWPRRVTATYREDFSTGYL